MFTLYRMVYILHWMFSQLRARALLYFILWHCYLRFAFFGFISYFYMYPIKRLLIQPTKIPLQKKAILNHQQLIQGDFQNKYQNKN